MFGTKFSRLDEMPPQPPLPPTPPACALCGGDGQGAEDKTSPVHDLTGGLVRVFQASNGDTSLDKYACAECTRDAVALWSCAAVKRCAPIARSRMADPKASLDGSGMPPQPQPPSVA